MKRRRETLEERRRRARSVLRRLSRAYPDARCSLDYSSPLELLMATILSAQCTDVRVNLVTPALFRKYRTAADYARAPAGELERDIRQTGFFNSKAKSLRRAGATIAAEHRHERKPASRPTVPNSESSFILLVRSRLSLGGVLRAEGQRRNNSA